MPADYSRIHDPDLREHYVYRLLGPRGRLLYIGCSSNLALRLSEHRRRFGDRLGRVETEGPFNYQEARALERELIEELRPPHNVEWTPKHHRGRRHNLRPKAVR